MMRLRSVLLGFRGVGVFLVALAVLGAIAVFVVAAPFGAAAAFAIVFDDAADFAAGLDGVAADWASFGLLIGVSLIKGVFLGVFSGTSESTLSNGGHGPANTCLQRRTPSAIRALGLINIWRLLHLKPSQKLPGRLSPIGGAILAQRIVRGVSGFGDEPATEPVARERRVSPRYGVPLPAAGDQSKSFRGRRSNVRSGRKRPFACNPAAGQLSLIEQPRVENLQRRRQCHPERVELLADLDDMRARPLPTQRRLSVALVSGRKVALRVRLPLVIFAQARSLNQRIRRPVADHIIQVEDAAIGSSRKAAIAPSASSIA